MKKATKEQIMAVAGKFVAVGCSNGRLYGLAEDGERTTFTVSLYHDSLHNLSLAGRLTYNGDYTYSLVNNA